MELTIPAFSEISLMAVCVWSGLPCIRNTLSWLLRLGSRFNSTCAPDNRHISRIVSPPWNVNIALTFNRQTTRTNLQQLIGIQFLTETPTLHKRGHQHHLKKTICSLALHEFCQAGTLKRNNYVYVWVHWKINVQEQNFKH